MNENDLKIKLAEAESHYSRYEWDQAIACFEAVLQAQPNHGAAAQGLSDATAQKRVDEELVVTIAGARDLLAARQYGDALLALNHAQTRGALTHILKYHAEIDGLRTRAQECQEWQRRVEETVARARVLERQKKFDRALDILDASAHDLAARGLEELGEALRTERERLWTERDVEERIDYAQVAFARQDYRLAFELVETLRSQLPEREDLGRLYERYRLAWTECQNRLGSAREALDAGRPDDAVAILAALRREWPDNPDWRSLWLKVHMDHGRAQIAAGRRSVQEHRFEEAASAFGAACDALAAALDVFDGHPTAALERDEAHALREVATAATQAVRDAAAHRWEAARRGWEAAQQRLAVAVGVRQHDFGEIAAVVDSMLRDAIATVHALEHARLSLAEGQQALENRDAGRARECFRTGLSLSEKIPSDLRDSLQTGLHEADRAQREVRGLLSQAERHRDDRKRLALLRRAYDRWRTAPGLLDRLVDALLDAADQALQTSDAETAITCCEQVLGMPEAPLEAHDRAHELLGSISSRRKVQAALAGATRALTELESSPHPTAAGYRHVLDILIRAEAGARAVQERLEVTDLIQRVQDRHDRLSLAEPHLVRAETSRRAGEWSRVAQDLAEAVRLLGDMATADLVRAAGESRTVAGQVEAALSGAQQALAEAADAYTMAADGDLSAVQWPALWNALDQAHALLAAPPVGAEPLPPAWYELQRQVDDRSARAHLLAEAFQKFDEGSSVGALAALLGAGAARRTDDPVLAAVLRRLQQESAGDARALAYQRAAEAHSHAARGEVEDARARLAEARLYGEAAPEFTAELAHLERHLALLESIRQRSAEGRAAQAGGRLGEALAAYREALELAADEAMGLSADVRRQLLLLLDLEDELWDEHKVERGTELQQALEQGAAGQPLLQTHLLILLRSWWKLACRLASVGFIEGHLEVGDHQAACTRARHLFAMAPGDPLARALYVQARAAVQVQAAAAIRHAIATATRLRERGSLAEAAAALQRVESAVLGAEGAALETDAGLDEELKAALDDLAGLRLELGGLQALAVQLEPLLSRARAALLSGRLDEAAAALAEADDVDAHRQVASLWRDFEGLRARLAERRQETGRARLEAELSRVEAALELLEQTGRARLPESTGRTTLPSEDVAGLHRPGQPVPHVAEALEEVIATVDSLGTFAVSLDGALDGAWKMRLAEVRGRAAAAWENQQRVLLALETARRAGERDRNDERLLALERAAAGARGLLAEQLHGEIARARALAEAEANRAACQRITGLLRQARAALRTGDLAQAQERLDDVFDLEPDQPQAIRLQCRLEAAEALRQAHAAVDEGDWSVALGHARRAVAVDADFAEARELMGRVEDRLAAAGALSRALALAHEGFFAGARAELSAVQAVGPADADLLQAQEHLQNLETRFRQDVLGRAREAADHQDYGAALHVVAAALPHAWPELRAELALLLQDTVDRWADEVAGQAVAALEGSAASWDRLAALHGLVRDVSAADPPPSAGRSGRLSSLEKRLATEIRLAEQGLVARELAAEQARRDELVAQARRLLAGAQSLAGLAAARTVVETGLRRFDAAEDPELLALHQEIAREIRCYQATMQVIEQARRRLRSRAYARAREGLESVVEPSALLRAELLDLIALSLDLETAEDCRRSNPEMALAIYERAARTQPDLAHSIAAAIAACRVALSQRTPPEVAAPEPLVVPADPPDESPAPQEAAPIVTLGSTGTKGLSVAAGGQAAELPAARDFHDGEGPLVVESISRPDPAEEPQRGEAPAPPEPSISREAGPLADDPAPAQPPEAEAPPEMPAGAPELLGPQLPFDVDDWLSNVTPVTWEEDDDGRP